METRNEIRFILNGEEVRRKDVRAAETLLDFLRLERRMTGTKEGCAEGDCGACTVLVGRLSEGALVYEPVNACIRFLATVDGCHVVTIEHLRGADGGLHPVQRAMVEHHGSQCGFCTPGIVMALYALWMRVPEPSVTQIETALQGNLCRCTGYAPIIRAAQAVGAQGDPLEGERAAVKTRLEQLNDGARVLLEDGFMPGDLDDFAAVYADFSEATIVAGATDVGLWVTKFLRNIGPAIFIGHLEELRRIGKGAGGLMIGAGVSYEEALEELSGAYPHLGPYLARIAGWQVRGMGTIGGNIANGSPIGDMPPALIALGAQLVLRRGKARREMPLEDYFIEYGQQDRREGEFVEAVMLPAREGDWIDAVYKVSKRRDEDISAVACGISIRLEGEVIAEARIAFGGMAGTPKRAEATEAALVGEAFGEEAFDAAVEALAQDYSPLTDWRASAEYRMTVARNLLRRFWAEEGAGEVAQLVREDAT